jgi:glutamate synthase domain-containing protein 3
MTGGRAYLYDPGGRVPLRINAASVRATALPALGPGAKSRPDDRPRPDDGPRPDAAEREAELRALIAAQAAEGSGLAATLLARWETERASFWLVEPAVTG